MEGGWGVKSTHSPADEAFTHFQQLLQSKSLAGADSPKLSEADTRAKLIDPIFKSILGWHEGDIRREEPVESGYIDYTLGAESPYLLIEAKRTLPRFRLNDPNQSRRLRLSGPHLLGQTKVRPFIEQVARYAFDKG